jgi:hypothetical protein
MFFIGRIVFSMLFWVVLARWTYAEISHASPALASSLDSLIEVATIPTHDQWDLTSAQEFAHNLVEQLRTGEAQAEQE